MTQNVSAQESRLELIYRTIHLNPSTSFPTETLRYSDGDFEGDSELMSSWFSGMEEFVTHYVDNAPSGDPEGAPQRPHSGKCGCTPLTVPDQADRVVEDQLRQLGEKVREAEEARDRLVTFAAQATALSPGRIAQASGLNIRTVQRRIRDAGEVTSQAREYLALRLEGDQDQVDDAGVREALSMLAQASAGDRDLSEAEVKDVAARLGLSQRTVVRWGRPSR